MKRKKKKKLEENDIFWEKNQTKQQNLTFDTRQGMFMEFVAKPIGTVMAASTPKY